MARQKGGMSRMDEELLESARALHKLGALDDVALGKITLRHVRLKHLENAPVPSGKEITAIREANNMSQAVFARILDVTTGTLSKWERGEITPRGPARRLLATIKAKGIEAIL